MQENRAIPSNVQTMAKMSAIKKVFCFDLLKSSFIDTATYFLMP